MCRRQVSAVLSCVFLFGLAACGSSVTRPSDSSATTVTSGARSVSPTNPLGAVSIELTDLGKKRAVETPEFSSDALLSSVKQALSARGLLTEPAPAGAPTLTVEITGMRVRGAASAIVLGVLAGADTLHGVVYLKNEKGDTIDTFKVDVSYAWGGVGGRPTGTRMTWMYGEFAKDVAENLTAKQSASQQKR